MNTKKIIYIFLTSVSGLIFSFLIHSVVEIIYINRLLSEGVLPEPSAFTHRCYLPSFLQVFLFLAGIFGGFFLGVFSWRKFYKIKAKIK